MTAPAAKAEGLLFERVIRPILKAHCFQCHGEDGVRESDIDLRLRRWIIAGGELGPPIEPGDPCIEDEDEDVHIHTCNQCGTSVQLVSNRFIGCRHTRLLLVQVALPRRTRTAVTAPRTLHR